MVSRGMTNERPYSRLRRIAGREVLLELGQAEIGNVLKVVQDISDMSIHTTEVNVKSFYLVCGVLAIMGVLSMVVI